MAPPSIAHRLSRWWRRRGNVPYDVVSVDGDETELLPTLLSLQGLANRHGPRIFLAPLGDIGQRHWLNWYESYGLAPRSIRGIDLVERYRDATAGFVVYDPDVPDSLNIAMTLAGLDDLVVCHPTCAPQLERLGIKEAIDLRDRWTSRHEAYRWAVDHLFPRCSKDIVANYEQPDTARPVPSMDIAVAEHALCLGLTINRADHPELASLWSPVYDGLSPGAKVIGWHTEDDSEGSWVSTHSGRDLRVYCARAWNMSFHRHVQAKGPYQQRHCEGASCNPQGRYATFVVSDGDSWDAMTLGMGAFWLDPRRGEVPLGWEVSPVFADVGPAVLEHYYRTASANDYLICGPSGVSYAYWSCLGDPTSFLRETADSLRRTSLRSIWAINRVVTHLPGGQLEHRLGEGPVCYTRSEARGFHGVKDERGADWVDDEAVHGYLRELPDCDGFFQGWERIPNEEPRWQGSRPWFPNKVLASGEVADVTTAIEREAEAQARPAFVPVHVSVFKFDLQRVVETVSRLRTLGIEVLRPDVFLRTAQDARARGMR